MSGKKKLWEPKVDIKLVELVKRNTHIWNTTHENFSNLRRRKETFTLIAKKLGTNFTADSVKERWKNIRNTYRHNLRRTKSYSMNIGDVYEPSWHLWPMLKFLHNQEDPTCDVNIFHGDIKLENEDRNFMEDALTEHKEKEEDIYTRCCKGNANLLDKQCVSKSECETLLYKAKNILTILKSDPRLDLKIDIKCANFGRKVANCLSAMSKRDADEASRKIRDILLFYNQCIDED